MDDEPKNGANLRLPWCLIVTAFTIAMVGLAGWSLALERTKADRAELAAKAQQAEVDQFRSDLIPRLVRIENLLIQHIQQTGAHR